MLQCCTDDLPFSLLLNALSFVESTVCYLTVPDILGKEGHVTQYTITITYFQLFHRVCNSPHISDGVKCSRHKLTWELRLLPNWKPERGERGCIITHYSTITTKSIVFTGNIRVSISVRTHNFNDSHKCHKIYWNKKKKKKTTMETKQRNHWLATWLARHTFKWLSH